MDLSGTLLIFGKFIPSSLSAFVYCSMSSKYNFEISEASFLFKQFNDAENECKNLLDDKKNPLALPAYHQCIKASHIFNLLDARGVISVSERQSYILRVRSMARSSCLAWMGKLNE